MVEHGVFTITGLTAPPPLCNAGDNLGQCEDNFGQSGDNSTVDSWTVYPGQWSRRTLSIWTVDSVSCDDANWTIFRQLVEEKSDRLLSELLSCRSLVTDTGAYTSLIL